MLASQSKSTSGIRYQVSGIRYHVLHPAGARDGTMNRIPTNANHKTARYTQTESVDPEITLLCSRARAGDEESFAKLFDFYIDRLRMYVRG